jgi:TPR repeat protein
MHYLKNLIFLYLCLVSSCCFAKLTQDEEHAKIEGIILYNQYKVAAPQLLIAANAGDSDAQFYLGNEIRNSKKYVTPDALKWYKASADQENYYAILQLARLDSDPCNITKTCNLDGRTTNDWFKMLINTLKPLADNGDGEAMAVLYNATGKIEWLEKSAKANYPQGQWMLANLYQDGKGVFFIPGSREKAVAELLKSASENGNPKAMLRYFGKLRGQKSFLEARHWLEQAAETGYANAVYNYGYFLAVEPEAIGFEKDLIKGYALILTLKTLDGGGNMQQDVNDTLPEITSQMTSEQISEGEMLAKTWEAHHPALSFFPDKLTY